MNSTEKHTSIVDRPTIFLALHRFNHYSDILRGRLILGLAERFRVIVITPDLDENALRAYGYVTRPGIIYTQLSVRYEWLWKTAELYIRKYFVRSFDDLFITQHWYYGFLHTAKDRALRFIGSFLPKRLATPALFTRLEMLLVRVSPEFRALCREFLPSLVVLPTPGWGYMPFVAEMMIFARKMKIPTVAINCTYDQPYSQAKFIRKTDYMMVNTPGMKNDMMRLHGYSEESLFVAGCLKFDHYFSDRLAGRMRTREEFLRSKNLDHAKKLILYATPSPGVYKDRMEIMKEIVRLKREKKFLGDPNIIVRLHPFEYPRPYQEFLGIPGIYIEGGGCERAPEAYPGPRREMDEEDLVNLTESLTYADVVVNFASSLTIESAIFDTPVVNVGFRERHRVFYEYETNRAIRHLGATRFASSLEELSVCINDYLSNPGLEKEKRAQLVKEFIYFADGKSYLRVAETLEKIITKK